MNFIGCSKLLFCILSACTLISACSSHESVVEVHDDGIKAAQLFDVDIRSKIAGTEWFLERIVNANGSAQIVTALEYQKFYKIAFATYLVNNKTIHAMKLGAALQPASARYTLEGNLYRVVYYYQPIVETIPVNYPEFNENTNRTFQESFYNDRAHILSFENGELHFTSDEGVILVFVPSE